MALTDDQVTQIEQYQAEHGPSTCPMCSGKEWTLRPNLGAVCAQSKGGVNLFKTLQVIQWVCGTCGFVVTYDAERIGASIEVNPKAKF